MKQDVLKIDNSVDNKANAFFQDEICLTPREKILLAMKLNTADGEPVPSERPMHKPESLPDGWVYDNIKDAIYHCRRIYYIYLLILCYTLLTILTTPTLDFFKEQIIQMPIMNARMPLNFYLIIAPLLLIGFFIYKQLYLYKTNRLIKFAIDECKRLNKNNCKGCSGVSSQCTLNSICSHHLSRLYPWIIIYCRFIEDNRRLHTEKDALGIWIGKFQKTFVNFSLWGLLPMILALLSIFVVKKHSLGLSTYMIAVTCLGSGVVAFFWYHQQLLVEQRKSVSFLFSFATAIATVGGVLILIWLNAMALNTRWLWFEKPWDTSLSAIETLIRNVAYADLSYKVISDNPKDDREFWIDLKGSHFEGANFSYSKLKKANLSDSKLQHAVFVQANLEDASLDGADAAGVDFINSILREASFNSATLRYTDFSNAKLQGAKFSGSDLLYANFGCADLNGTNFYSANLKGADLSNANLQNADLGEAIGIRIEQLKEAKNHLLARYSKEWLDKLGLGEDHNDRVQAKRFGRYNFTQANLANADFKEADLKNADLIAANLRDANFEGAKLNDADMDGAILDYAVFRNAELKGAKNLIAEQFAKVITLHGARIDAALRREIKEKYPNLFNSPDDPTVDSYGSVSKRSKEHSGA